MRKVGNNLLIIQSHIWSLNRLAGKLARIKEYRWSTGSIRRGRKTATFLMVKRILLRWVMLRDVSIRNLSYNL